MPKRAQEPLARRSPRFTLAVDWFIESAGCSTLGRGLELSVRGALLPLAFTSPFAPHVTLFVSLPLRERMFKARCSASQTERGWVLDFEEVAPEDLQLLGHTLIGEFGLAAFPNLERRPPVELDLQKNKQY
jgi:hypothetical protein